MRNSIALLTLVFICLACFTADVSAQNARGSKGKSTLPTDPKLIELHKDFVNKAEKLGDEYANKKDWEKARVVFQEILKLVPQYDSAKEKLVHIRKNLAQANRKVVSVDASRDWLDTKIDLEKGSPLAFKTNGEWMFVFEGDADGIIIPREFSKYQLGSLIAMIVAPGEEKEPPPFTIGKEWSDSVPKTGRLYLKMHDGYNKNNRGSIEVEISGNFE